MGYWDGRDGSAMGLAGRQETKRKRRSREYMLACRNVLFGCTGPGTGDGCASGSRGVGAAAATAAAAEPSAVGRGFEAFRTPGRGAGRESRRGRVVQSDDDGDSSEEAEEGSNDGFVIPDGVVEMEDGAWLETDEEEEEYAFSSGYDDSSGSTEEEEEEEEDDVDDESDFGDYRTPGRDAVTTPRRGGGGGAVAVPAGPPHYIGSTPRTDVSSKVHSAARCKTPDRNFARQRATLSRSWFAAFNREVFGGRLPDDTPLVWNPRLTKTAGMTRMRRKGDPLAGTICRVCEIELSVKVIDDEFRLQKTLLHEMCHVAQFLLDQVSRPPHGREFMKWALIATTRYPELRVTVKHDYKIHAAHRYECVKCARIYARHSKSIDVDKKVCGICKGPLMYTGAADRRGGVVQQRTPNRYNMFIKASYGRVRREQPQLSQKEVFQLLSQEWKSRRTETTSAAKEDNGDENLRTSNGERRTYDSAA
eukprot:GHVU01168992.1.p1 GENE.GHVU01168992.1~~GHVU01168992.1.p1  ORF type:complete len:477 (+),score=101.21 GHVU01168992.1:379-1809(+)